MTRRPEDSDIIGTAPDPLAGTPLALQREAAPECVRPVAIVTMPGPGTRARQEAKAKADRSLPDRQRRILLALTAHGPQTRLALTTTTGLSENSVNSAVSAMLHADPPLVHILDALDPLTQRGLVAVRPPTLED